LKEKRRAPAYSRALIRDFVNSNWLYFILTHPFAPHHANKFAHCRTLEYAVPYFAVNCHIIHYPVTSQIMGCTNILRLNLILCEL